MKHIVQFQLREGIPSEEKAQVMNDFKQGIEHLPEVIPCIRRIEVGFNQNPAEKFDICLYSEFETLADIQAYAVHPAHVAVAAKLKPYVSVRSCVDY